MNASLLAKVTDPSCRRPCVLADYLGLHEKWESQNSGIQEGESYRYTGKLVNGVAGIGEVFGEQSFGSGVEV